jgi:hypothetical protein
MEGYVYPQVIVEGTTDEPVVTVLMHAAGWADHEFFVRSVNGKGAIDRDIKNYWEAAQHVPYVVFRDLDRDEGGCPVAVRSMLSSKTPGESPNLLIRIVDQCIESWILADRQGVAEFFERPIASVRPRDSRPKDHLLRLFQKPQFKDAVLHEGGKLAFGPAYATHLHHLMTHHWSIERAAAESDSLRRALERLTELHNRLGGGTQ